MTCIGKVLFVNASSLVKKEKTISYLTDEHINTIYNAYEEYRNIEGLSKVVDISEILSNRASLNINLYVNQYASSTTDYFEESYCNWIRSSENLEEVLTSLFNKVLYK